MEFFTLKSHDLHRFYHPAFSGNVAFPCNDQLGGILCQSHLLTSCSGAAEASLNRFTATKPSMDHCF
jgi:hypothetical protein